MQAVPRASAAIVLACLCCGAWAKAPVTFSDIERMNSTPGLHISQLSSMEMDTIEGSLAPIVVAAGVAGAAVASGARYFMGADNPNVRDFAWYTSLGFTGGTLAAIAATMPPVAASITTLGGALLPLLPPPPRDFNPDDCAVRAC
ncbi:hypothetical protein CF68_06080 [Cupriavidus sp. SK-4]|uniref:hypothetical protein n=1 Tax=Cupriavidus sp. SK-4 TaxID=574750 RepID=UPI00044B0261|nr:hypothetical protein [Cupriavidus sp. SK-4]EYS86461.1 hypothetical protein CF68_06080 [Cupriavidus sp. SK-4]